MKRPARARKFGPVKKLVAVKKRVAVKKPVPVRSGPGTIGAQTGHDPAKAAARMI